MTCSQSVRDRDACFRLLKQAVKTGGYALIAAFAKGGARRCFGLDFVQYDPQMIADARGDCFGPVACLHHAYIYPSGGERPCIHALFKRVC